MIILTGFMGSGKTTVGKILAQKLSLPFVDLDEAVEKQTGLAPQFYIPRFGEAAFRRVEKICLQSTLETASCVLATGGGIVLDRQNRTRMLQKGWVVWLDVPLGVLRRRLSSARNRPLWVPKEIPKMYAQRQKGYRQCHFRVEGDREAEAIAISILKRYRRYACTRSS